jgi:hypothetical protein
VLTARQTKEAFRRHGALKDEVEIKRAVRRGRDVVKEMIAVIQLKKYRQVGIVKAL